MNTQKSKSEILVKKASSILHEFSLDDFVIFGSSALVLNDVTLRREVNDLDLFVSDKTFEKLDRNFSVEIKKTEDGDIPYYILSEEIEVFKEFRGAIFQDIFIWSKVTMSSCGFRVANIVDIIVWKGIQDREKDRDDLIAIREHLQ